MNAKVLVVEDNDIARLIETKTIQKFHCDVDTAKNGNEALDKLTHQHYDLVFMDIGLPDINGLKVTETIRNTENMNKKVPIVALTGHDENAANNQATFAGMDSFIVKPLTEENCAKTLKKYIKVDL